MTSTAQAHLDGGALLEPAARRDRPLTEPAVLLLVVMALMALGILMVYSASRTVYAGDSWFFTKHLMFVPLALGAIAAGAYFPHRWLNRCWPAVSVIGVAVLLLAAVLVFGEERNNARRWFAVALGPMRLSFQPSEFAKFAMVIFFAWFFSRPGAQPRSLLAGFLPALGLVGLVCALIAKEDFGTAALVGLVSVALCLIAGWRWWFTFLLVLPGALGFLRFVWLVEYRRERLEIYLDPWKYFDGKGWHVCQSLMGIGSGGLWGVGLGAGIQKLYIPEVTTDFIFAAICEEMGLLGGLLVLGLFGAFVWRAGRVVRSAPDRFSFLLASGILLVIGLQAALNIGVVTGALPAKGISLPFISYGGSGLVMMSFAVGLLISIARRTGGAPQTQAAQAQAVHPQPLVYVPMPSAAVPNADAARPVRRVESAGADLPGRGCAVGAAFFGSRHTSGGCAR